MFKVGDIVQITTNIYNTKHHVRKIGSISGILYYIDGYHYYPSELMLVRSAEAGANPAASSTQLHMEDTYMSTSTSLVGAAPVAPATTKRRRDLQIGDLYRNRDGGKVYMATGIRTAPPSGGGSVTVVVDGNTVADVRPASLGRTGAGETIVGFQGIVVRGRVNPGQDGATVTFNGDKEVVYLGRASINLPTGV